MSALLQSSRKLSTFQRLSFDRWWDMDGEWVEEQNQRRGGESGVKILPAQGQDRSRLFSKRQTGHLYRTLLHPFGRPTVLREEQALIACEKLGVPVPKRVFCAARKRDGSWQALLVTEELRGFVDLDRWYAEQVDNLSEIQRQRVLQQLADVLHRLHLGRRQHGCLYAKHIYVRVQGEEVAVALLDLEKSRRRLLRRLAVRHDLRQLYRRRGAMPQADWDYLLSCYRSLTSGNAETPDAT